MPNQVRPSVAAIAVIALLATAAAPPSPSASSTADAAEDLEVPATTAPGANSSPGVAAAPAPSAAAARDALPSKDETRDEAGKGGASPAASAAPPPSSKLTPSPFSATVPRGFSVGGYVQADYLHGQASEDQLQQTSIPLNQNRFYLRRGRLRVDRGWQYAAATLELDANTVSGPVVGIRRAEASIFHQGKNATDLPPLVMVTAGITDLPFGYESFESERAAPFTERSLIASSLFPTKQDAGVKVSGALAFLRYAVAVSNGEPVDSKGFPRDPNDSKDVTGRLGVVARVREDVELTGGASFAQGKGFSPGGAATKGGFTWSDQNGNGQVDAIEIAPSFPSAATPSASFKRWAFGLDLGLRFRTSLGETHVHGELIAASNYDRGFLVSDPGGGNDTRQLGGYAAVTQDITEYGIVGFRVSVYDPNADILETRAGKLEPKTQTVRTLSPMVGLRLPGPARFIFQYDSVHDYLARDAVGVPTDAKNDVYIGRLQVDL